MHYILWGKKAVLTGVFLETETRQKGLQNNCGSMRCHLSTNLYASLSFCGCPEIASMGVFQSPQKAPWYRAEVKVVKLGYF